jgi:hypothetical protein
LTRSVNEDFFQKILRENKSVFVDIAGNEILNGSPMRFQLSENLIQDVGFPV